MVLNHVKLALLTGFTLMANAKRGKYAYRENVDETDEIVNDSDDFLADSWNAQKDSRYPGILNKGPRDGKKGKQDKQSKKKGKKKKKSQEKDFARGVLDAIVQAVAETDDPEETITLGQLGAMFDAIVGEDFDPNGNDAFGRGFEFGEKRLYGGEKGCRDECRDAPFAEGCQECCTSFEHTVDWNCDGSDPEKPVAKCCTEWSEDCYRKDSEDNNNHACKDCGYGRGYGYGRSYGGYGYGGYRGRRRAGRGYGRGGRRRAGRGYGRGGRRRAYGYGRRGYGTGRGYGYGRSYGYGR